MEAQGYRRIARMQSVDDAEHMLLLVEIVDLRVLDCLQRRLPEIGQPAGARHVPCPRGLACGIGDDVQHMPVEDVELDCLAARRNGIGKPVRLGDVDRFCGRQSVDRLGDFETAILGEEDGVARAAAGALNDPYPFRLAFRQAGVEAFQDSHQFLRAQRLQQDSLAARADGRQQAPDGMGDQNEERTRGRLFKILQQRIGSVGVHVVCRIDDDDPVAAVMRGHREEFVDLADLVDGNDRLERFGLVVDRASEVQH